LVAAEPSAALAAAPALSRHGVSQLAHLVVRIREAEGEQAITTAATDATAMATDGHGPTGAGDVRRPVRRRRLLIPPSGGAAPEMWAASTAKVHDVARRVIPQIAAMRSHNRSAAVEGVAMADATSDARRPRRDSATRLEVALDRLGLFGRNRVECISPSRLSISSCRSSMFMILSLRSH